MQGNFKNTHPDLMNVSVTRAEDQVMINKRLTMAIQSSGVGRIISHINIAVPLIISCSKVTRDAKALTQPCDV